MNVRPMGPTLARGGKLTLARCVWYPGPGLMEKACFHSCQSHLLRTTPRLHTHVEDRRLPISHTPYPSAPPRPFVFVILWTRSGGNYEQNNTNNTRLCLLAPRRCVWMFSVAAVAVSYLEHQGFSQSCSILYWCVCVKKPFNLLHIRLRLYLLFSGVWRC